jgi:hypothetical protein
MKKQIFCIMALAVAMTAKADIVTTVSSVKDLQDFAESVNKGDEYSGVTVTLTKDLNLSGVDWTPIGTALTDKETGKDYQFKGTFNGGGYTISNINVNVDGSATGNVAGLFGQIGAGGIVKDVNISGGTIVLKSLTGVVNCAVGSIAGYNNGTIVGCSNSAEVRGNWDNASVGGITGENGSTGVIQNCYNTGQVYTGSYENNKLGGIAGENNHFIKNCFVKATISKVGSYGQICGNSGGTVTGCFYLNGTSGDYATEDLLVLNDASANSFSVPASSKHVLLDGRTLYADEGWNTICFPFSIPAGADGYSPIAGATVMTLSSSSFAAGTLTLTFADATSIVAGKPYIIKWNKVIDDDLPNPVFLGVTVSNTTTNTTTTYTDFVGSFSPMSFTANDRTLLYLGAANKLYYPNAAMSLGSCRAYFQLKGITAGDVSTTRMTFEDNETTGIVEAEANSSLFTHHSSLSDWYDLSGRKVSKPTTKGLYIHKGRKVVIK